MIHGRSLMGFCILFKRPRYDGSMKSLVSLASQAGLRGARKLPEFFQSHEDRTTFQIVGWTSVALGIAALGLYVGHELRSRYKFKHRTPYDFYAHAGDSIPAADYGVGI
jgi:hypothetical protein